MSNTLEEVKSDAEQALSQEPSESTAVERSASQESTGSKERQEHFSKKIEHMKKAHAVPEGMHEITKTDAKSFTETQGEYAFEEPEKTLSAKVVMSAMVNDMQHSTSSTPSADK